MKPFRKSSCSGEKKVQILEDLRNYFTVLNERNTEAVKTGSVAGGGTVSSEDIKVQSEIDDELLFRSTVVPTVNLHNFQQKSGLHLDLAEALNLYVLELQIEGISRRLELSAMSEWMIVRQEKLLMDCFYNANYLIAMSHYNWENGHVFRSVMHRIAAELYEWSAQATYRSAVANECLTAYKCIKTYQKTLSEQMSTRPDIGRGTEWTAASGAILPDHIGSSVQTPCSAPDDLALLREHWAARVQSDMFDVNFNEDKYLLEGAGWSLGKLPRTVRLKWTRNRSIAVCQADLDAVRGCWPDFIKPNLGDSFSSIGSHLGAGNFKYASAEPDADKIRSPEKLTGNVRQPRAK